MARIRTIKPEFFSHEQLASKTPHARLLAIGLLTMADCEGRLRWVPMQVHAQIFPWEELGKHSGASPGSIEDLLRELIECNYVVHYEVAGKRYVEIVNFKKHQRLSGKESSFQSRLPPIPENFKIPNESKCNTSEAEVKHPGASPGSSENPLGTGEQGNRGTEDYKRLSAIGGRSKTDYSEWFEKFWIAFPKVRRTKKQEAFRRWKQVIKTVDADLLIRRAEEYARSDKGRSKFAVMPSVWLESGMWEDEPEAWGSGEVYHDRTPTAEQLANWNPVDGGLS